VLFGAVPVNPATEALVDTYTGIPPAVIQPNTHDSSEMKADYGTGLTVTWLVYLSVFCCCFWCFPPCEPFKESFLEAFSSKQTFIAEDHPSWLPDASAVEMNDASTDAYNKAVEAEKQKHDGQAAAADDEMACE